MSDVSHYLLKVAISYNPETGRFAWLKKVNQNVVVGSEPGFINIHGYRIFSFMGRSANASRWAYFYMTGEWPLEQMDHINGIRHDNRWGNLRHVSGQENQRNQKRPKSNKSGVVGVFWAKNRKKWMAQIIVDYQKIHLGITKDFFEACCARKSAENDYSFHPNHGREQ